MNEMAVSRDVAVRPDAIIVVGAGLRHFVINTNAVTDTDKNVICSLQTMHNMEKALDLLEELGTKDINLVFSGGFSLDSKTEAETMLEYLKDTQPDIYNCFDEEFRKHTGDFESNSFIYLETQSRNSSEQIYNILDLIQKENWRRVIIIDQPMHLLQLKLLVAKELRKRNLRHVFVEFVGAKPVWGGNDQKQWRNPIIFAIYEFLSTGYYLLKGKII